MERQIHVLRTDISKAISFTVFGDRGKILRRGKIKTGGKPYRQGEEHLWIYDDEIEKKVVFKYRKIVSKPIPLCAYLPDLKIRIGKGALFVDFYVHGLKKTGKMDTLTLKSKEFRYRGGKIDFYVYAQKKNKNRKYKLILAFDGQNLFSKRGVGNYTDKNDPYGSWQIDQILSRVEKEKETPYLVVAMDNANPNRDRDLTMSENFGKINREYTDNKRFFHGKLELIGEKIVQDLFPYLKENYEIDWDDVGVIGASSGGLAAYYMGTKYKEMFSYVFAFSPALLLFRKEDLDSLIENEGEYPYVFFSGGSESLLEDAITGYVKSIYPLIVSRIGSATLHIEEEYEHNEIAWRYVFASAMSDYFAQKSRNSINSSNESVLK